MPGSRHPHGEGLVIGLTGGIGSGKSTVSQMLTDLGAHLVDTDAISRSLTAAGGAAIPHIASHLEALHKTKEETGDFDLTCQGKVVKAHRLILSMRWSCPFHLKSHVVLQQV